MGHHLLVTPTCNRPIAIPLLERCIQRQKAEGESWEWIVADDSTPHVSLSLGQTHIKRESSPTPTESFRSNYKALFDAALEREWEYCFVVEDDSWHSPDYIRRYLEEGRKHDAQLIGEAKSVFYHMALGSRRYNNRKHSCLCRTAIRRDAFHLLVETLDDPATTHLLDRAVWDKDCKKYLFPTSGLVVSFKGMPGKKGFVSHTLTKGERRRIKPDPHYKDLRGLVGDDADDYISICESVRKR